MELRIASYNVHKCVGMDRRRDPGRIVTVLNALGADIIALQEVDHRLGRRPAALPPGLIESDTDFGILPFSTSEPSLGWHGQTILVRRGIAVSRIRRIQLPGLEPRGALMAEIDGPETGLRVVAVHLGLIRRYRRMQLAAIRAALSHRAEMPTLIVGDFNEWSLRGGVETLSPEFHVHAPGRTFPAPRPLAALDRIALHPGLELRDTHVFAGGAARMASDHLPICIDLKTGA